jgi:hypothetical protein
MTQGCAAGLDVPSLHPGLNSVALTGLAAGPITLAHMSKCPVALAGHLLELPSVQNPAERFGSCLIRRRAAFRTGKGFGAFCERLCQRVGRRFGRREERCPRREPAIEFVHAPGSRTFSNAAIVCRETSHILSAGLKMSTARLGGFCVYTGKARKKDRIPVGELGNNGQAAAHSFNVTTQSGNQQVATLF